MNRFDLEKRLIKFSVTIISITNDLPGTKAGNHLAGQLLRSGTSVALNYGEAQSAESRKDFIHKMKIILKELRETLVCLEIICRSKTYKNPQELSSTRKETDELISIFVKSIKTAEQNLRERS